MLNFAILMLFLGIPPGIFWKNNPKIQKISGKLFNFSVWILLFFMGIGLGLDKNLMQQLTHLGFQALILSLFACTGSVLAAWFMGSCFFPDSFTENRTRNLEQKSKNTQSQLKENLIILTDTFLVLLFFIGGILFGYYEIINHGVFVNYLAEYTLYLLLFLAGMFVGFDLKAFRILQELKGKVLLIPILTIMSSLLFGVLASFILPQISIYESLLVTAGLGYYSLTTTLISQEINPALGSIALLSNVLREVFTLILAPILIRFFGKLAPVMLGGATANDCTLPAIAKYCGERYAILAVFSGVVLTTVVPFLLSFLLYFK